MSCTVAIDTSDRRADIAVINQGQVAKRISANSTSVEELPEMLLACLNELKIDFANIDLLLTTLGPGSFTGIRSGLAYCLGLSQSLGIKLVGLSSILARISELAQNQSEVYLTASAKQGFCSKISHSNALSLPIGLIQCRDLSELENAVCLDEVSGALGSIKLLQKISLDELLKLLGNQSQHLMVSKDYSGLTPLYVKSINAKTLVERGLR